MLKVTMFPLLLENLEINKEAHRRLAIDSHVLEVKKCIFEGQVELQYN